MDPLSQVSVVVVCWRSARDMPPFLHALAPALARGTELVVVENGSGDETPALVRALLPPAHLIVNPDNRGFASAANQGWRAARGRFVLLLNPDSVLPVETLERTLEHLAGDPTIGVLGCRTLGDDGTPQPTVDRFPEVRTLIAEALRRRRGPSQRPRGYSPEVTIDVDWLYGSFLLCRREMLEALGGLDEAYEMYGEDIDVCHRARAIGYRVVYFAGASVVHAGNRSGAQRYGEERDVAVLEGTLRFLRRRQGRTQERLFRLAGGTSFAVKSVVARLPLRRRSPEQARLYGRMAGLCLHGDPEARRDPPPPPLRLDAARARGTAEEPASASPAFSIALPVRSSDPDPAPALASLRASADRTGERYEILVCANGPTEGGEPAVASVRELAQREGLPFLIDGGAGEQSGASSHMGHPPVRVLRLAEQSKVLAWNALHGAARAPLMVFADADVRVGREAVPRLLAHLRLAPGLAAVGAREVVSLAGDDDLAARLAALPFRFDFGNLPGRLYALRRAAIVEPIPAGVLHEDAYLSVLLGRRRYARESGAEVFLRPPSGWREYFRQRLRNDLGSLQLARQHRDLRALHGFGRTPWSATLREVRPREYPLLLLLLVLRAACRMRARYVARHGFPRTWSALPSTNRWPERVGGESRQTPDLARR